MNIESKPIYDCIIIGGGISGISFAHNLSRIGKNVLMLEKEQNIGGQIQTYTSKNYPDFWVEVGAHTCYNSYTGLLSMVNESGLQDEILSLDKCSYVLSTNDGIKSIFSQISILPLMFKGSRVFFSSRKGKTVKEYFRPIVGGKNYDRLFSRMFRAVICQPADDYPSEFFLKRRKGRMKEMPRKYSFKGGLQSMLNSLVKKDNIEVKTNTEILDIVLEDNIYKIRTIDGERFYSHNIAVSTNPKIAANLLKNIEPQVSRLLSTISLSRSETLNIVVEKDKLDLQKVAGIIPVSNEFMSAVSRDVAEHPHLRSFSFHFLGNNKKDNEKMDIVCRVLNIEQSDILEYSFAFHTLPSPRKEHINIAQQVNDLRLNNNIFLLGNYYYGMSLEDCIHRSRDEFERYNYQ